jgi:hypothetical protein
MDNEIRALTKQIQHLKIEKEISQWDTVRPILSEKLGRTISRQTLSMAINKNRSGKAYKEILMALHDVLAAWPKAA